MNYYVDGTFTKADFHFDSNDNLFTSIYSVENSNYDLIEIDAKLHQNIVDESFKEIASFYNKYDFIFQNFEQKQGFNPWFLEHFRLYFTHRNFLLKIASIEAFLKRFPNGKIITNDNRICSFFHSNALRLIDKSNKKPYRFDVFLSEFKNILFSKSRVSNANDVLIFDSSRSTFGKLNKFYPSIFLRNLLTPLPKNIKFSDSDFFIKKYLLRFTWIKDFKKIIKAYDCLRQRLYNEVNDSDNDLLILDSFIKNIKSQYIYFLLFKSFNYFFKTNTLRAILLSDENSPQIKVLQYAAKLNDIKVFAFQHGSIHSLHPAYIYGSYSSKPVLPDVTFLWGTYFEKKLIEEGGYKKSNLDVSGKINSILNSNKNSDISDSKKVVLFATQPQRDPNLRRKQIEDVMLALKEFSKEFQLVIRPHPNELSDEYFLEISKSVDFHDLLIDRVSDLNTHFDTCFLMITSFSTVGTEFIPYFKPMIILDYLDQDLIGYIKKGVGLKARNRQDLIDIFSNEIHIDKKSYETFIEEFFYKIDNLAEQRIIERIHSEINPQ